MIGRGYVIEHFDDCLYEWSIIEYRSVIRMTREPVIISNLGGLVEQAQGLFEGAVCRAESIAELVADPSRVCLLDMRADRGLTTDDRSEFDYFLYGGILGDHPPRDRTKKLRDLGYPLRHLGSHQMPTNTAVNVSKLILEDGMRLEDIRFVDDPEFVLPNEECEETVAMEGFRYIADENGRPIIEPDIIPLLAKDLLDDF